MDGSQPIATSPFLSGNYGPVRSEDDFELEVVGKIPEGLNGAFYRNGPNPQFEPRGTYHWFTGDGMIHGFFLDGGKARYRNRWVHTPRWEIENAAGQALFGAFGRGSDPSVVGKDGGVANTNIVHHAGRLMALVESNAPFEIDAETLEARGYVDTGGRFTAHPKMDTVNGEMVWFAYSAGEQALNPMIDFGITDRDGKITRRDRFEAPYTSMIHDFMVTENHVVFPVMPLEGSLPRAMQGGAPYMWRPELGNRIGVMRRDAAVDTIRWFETEASYVFHPMNSFEEGDLIHCDVMELPRAPLFPDAAGDLGNDAVAILVRWTFDLSNPENNFKRTVLSDLPGEFPRYDERRMGRSYRHGWYASLVDSKPKFGFDSLTYVDLETGKRETLRLPEGDVPGEPIFVPRSPDAAEGDGWLIALVYRAAQDRSELIVLDAMDITAGPVAVAKVPRRVPFGFHGNWVGA